MDTVKSTLRMTKLKQGEFTVLLNLTNEFKLELNLNSMILIPHLHCQPLFQEIHNSNAAQHFL